MRRVAITGFGVVSPIGTGKTAFWQSLREGRSGIGNITHFDCSTFDVRLAGEVGDSISLPEEVACVAESDIKVAFSYIACKEALEDACLDGLGSETLLHLGTSVEIFDLEKLVYDGKVDVARAAANRTEDGTCRFKVPLDTAAGLISDIFGRPGQSLTNVSACAASAQAIGHGFRVLRSGRFETAVCGGFDSMINPLGVGGFQLLGALTTDNGRGQYACRPFDVARNGTVLGEGAAVVIMEPLEKAKAEGKRVLAEVCGYGSTLDAFSLSAPDPNGDGACRSMLAALEDANIGPERIGHINAHGTGTRLNDEIEAKAIRRIFEGSWEDIPISATKSMTGHLIGAAGAVEVGACLLPLAEGVMPPNPCLEKIGRGCELNHVTGPALPFRGEYVLTNSFGFGGQNATLVLRKHDG